MLRLTPKLHSFFTIEYISKLESINIFTLTDFVNADSQLICTATSAAFRDVVQIKRYLVNKNSAVVKDALELYQNLKEKSAIIPTGITELDDLLEGGFLSGNIYEICGLAGSGKTQLCLHIVRNVVLTLEQNCYFLDSKNGFRAKRMNQLLQSRQQENSSALSRIHVKKVHTKYDLINSLHEIKDHLMNKIIKAKVIIIDSLPALFLDCGDRSENNGFLNEISSIMHYIASTCHATFIITNLITTWNDGDFRTAASTKENFCCGKYWSTVPNTSIKISVADDKNLIKHEIAVLSSNISVVGRKVKLQFLES